jgi:hypothetical protein
MPPLSSYNRFACLEVDSLIEPHICVANSTEVVQTHSHPPTPNQRSHLPAWECRLPVKYVVAASPGPMSLTVDVEIESMDTAVKRCTQALIDCGATGCFIDIKWAKLNNIPTCLLTKPIPVYNVDGTPNNAGMITDIADIILRDENHSECTQLAITCLCKGTSAHFLTFPLYSSTLLYSPLLSHTHPCSYVHFPTLCTITRCQTLNADDSRTSKTSTRPLVDYYCRQHPTLPLHSYL